MGGGCWTTSSYSEYSKSVGRSVSADGVLDGNYSAQEMFKQRCCAEELNPMNVVRECKDSQEHPNTVPVILGLDVTGSMGSAAVEVAKQLNTIMTTLYETCQDIEFMIMGIGDLSYDYSPIQLSQFESDIRIAEQLDKIWFEGHGGGNGFESYTVAWYMGSRHTDLDCLRRGKKGIIITMGDELLNPYLPHGPLNRHTGDLTQADIDTPMLYNEVKDKFDIYHLVVEHGCYNRGSSLSKSFAKVIGAENVKVVNLNSLSQTIIDIIQSRYDNINSESADQTETKVETISW